MKERTCRKCHVTKPLSDFQRHGRWHRGTCRQCRKVVMYRWESGLSSDHQERRAESQKRSTAAYLAKVKERTAAKHQERHEMLRGVVMSLYRDGLNQKTLAKLAGVGDKTLRRIESTEPLEKGITEPVEEKILRFYAKRKGVEA